MCLQAFHNLPNLIGLEFSNNRITAVPTGLFDKCSLLSTIYFTANRIERLQPGFSRGLSAQFEFLSLEQNAVADIDPFSLHTVMMMTKLLMTQNDLTVLRANRTQFCAGLAVWSLKQNKITMIETSAFAGMTSLTQLGLSNNYITVLRPEMFGPADWIPQGNYYRMRDGKKYKFQSVSLSDNRITSISAGIFDGLNSLATVTMDSNPLICPTASARYQSYMHFEVDFGNCTCTQSMDNTYILNVLADTCATCKEVYFQTTPSWNLTNEVTQAGFKTSYIAGDTYDTSPLRLGKQALFINYYLGDLESILYRLNFQDGALPGKFLVDSSTGK